MRPTDTRSIGFLFSSVHDDDDDDDDDDDGDDDVEKKKRCKKMQKQCHKEKMPKSYPKQNEAKRILNEQKDEHSRGTKNFFSTI